jgi:GR25 family glycosyltransferase involved in LPS biosynthesis
MKIGEYNIRPIVVTVPEEGHRTKFILEHFRSVGLDAEEFHGVSANESGLTTTHPYEVDNPGSGWKIGAKPTACWMSFYMLWAALNMQPDTHFLTLEWDAQFKPDWKERTEAALNQVPADFDVLFLGSCCAGGKPQKHIGGEVFEVKYPLCGHATIIAKKALPVFLRTQRKVYAPIDISLAFHTFPQLKVYTILPRVCDQFATALPD